MNSRQLYIRMASETSSNELMYVRSMLMQILCKFCTLKEVQRQNQSMRVVTRTVVD